MGKTGWAVACTGFVFFTLMLILPAIAVAAPDNTASAPSVPSGAASSAASPTPAPRMSSPVVAAASAAGPQYRIGAEDVLHVSVWESRELTIDVVVRPDGKISFPLIQDVQAEGLTAAELADVIQMKLLAYIKDPQVSVIVTQVNAPKIFVIGNVTRPGPYPLRGDVSVLQALSLAGGFTPFASPKKIKIVRSIEGKQEVRKVNYYEMIENGGGNYLLKPGDTIVVP